MIQLPDSFTLAAVCVALGAVVGAGGYHYLTSPNGESGPLTGRTDVWEPERFLAERDTSGQREPDVEIRYRTRVDSVRDVDTAYVPIPAELGENFRVSSPNPIEVDTDRVTFTAWDPRKNRYEQQLYQVPEPRLELDTYALAYLRNPPKLSVDPTRLGVGLGARLRWRRLSLRLEGTLSTRLRPQLDAALLWEL